MFPAQRLDAVCEVSMGQAPDGGAYNDEGDGWPLIAGAGDFGELYPAPKKYTTEASKLSKPGDIILGIRATIGEKVLSDGEYCLGRGVAGLRAKKDLDARFLWHWIEHVRPNLAAKGKGATFKQVNKQDIGELEIALPILPEQRRIAAILDQADALRAKRREALAQLDELQKAIFIEMFGDLVANSKGWDTGTSLGEVADIVSGVTKGRKLEGKSTREVPYLAVANVQDMRLNLEVVKHIDATEDEIARYALKEGDLLLTEGGDPDKLGRGTLWHGELYECIHQNHVFRVRLTSDKLTPYYLNWLVGSQRGKRYFLKSAKQTTGIASINMTQLRGFPLLLPPIELQRDFEKTIGSINSHRKRITSACIEMDALFASLQHRAFRGEL